MSRRLSHELWAIYLYVKRNYTELSVVGSATLFLTLKEYYPLWNDLTGALIYYAALPLLVIAVILRRNPLDFGLRPGNYRIWGFHVMATCLVALPVLLIASRFSGLQSYYAIAPFHPVTYSLRTVVSLLAWEFLFRGFLLFGLKGKLKESSILLQMVPFVLLHFGKPEIETTSTILTGLYFGYVAYRGNSYWPAFFIHLFINISFLLFVNCL